MGRGWAVEWLCVHPAQQEHSSGWLCHTGACCRHRDIFQMPQWNTATAPPHGEAGAEGLCSSPRSKPLLACCHSRAKHHCRLSVLQCSLPTLSMSRNIRSSILHCFQNNLQLHWFFVFTKKFLSSQKKQNKPELCIMGPGAKSWLCVHFNLLKHCGIGSFRPPVAGSALCSPQSANSRSQSLWPCSVLQDRTLD